MQKRKCSFYHSQQRLIIFPAQLCLARGILTWLLHRTLCLQAEKALLVAPGGAWLNTAVGYTHCTALHLCECRAEQLLSHRACTDNRDHTAGTLEIVKMTLKGWLWRAKPLANADLLVSELPLGLFQFQVFLFVLLLKKIKKKKKKEDAIAGKS